MNVKEAEKTIFEKPPIEIGSHWDLGSLAVNRGCWWVCI
jgi:hypothetical protein